MLNSMRVHALNCNKSLNCPEAQASSLQTILRKVKDIPRLLARLADTPGGFKAADFQVLKESMSSLVALRDVLLQTFKVGKAVPHS